MDYFGDFNEDFNKDFNEDLESAVVADGLEIKITYRVSQKKHSLSFDRP